MMARETKVGLAVTCSFLCLVGAVVFYKYRDGNSPANRLAPETPVSAAVAEASLHDALGGRQTAERIGPKLVKQAAAWGVPNPLPDGVTGPETSTTTKAHDTPEVPVPPGAPSPP